MSELDDLRGEVERWRDRHIRRTLKQFFPGDEEVEMPDWFVTAVTDEARMMSSTPQSVAQAAWDALLRASVAPPSA